MSWQIISSRDREFRNKEYQIAGINKITKYLNKLNILDINEKNLKIDLLKDYLYTYQYTNNEPNIYILLDNFFTNIDTPHMYNAIKNMCSNTDISNAIINYCAL